MNKLMSYSLDNICIKVIEVEQKGFKFFEITKESLDKNTILVQAQTTSLAKASEVFWDWIEQTKQEK